MKYEDRLCDDHYDNNHNETGVTDDDTVMRSIKAEAMLFGDIVQGSFIDSYRSMMMATMMMMTIICTGTCLTKQSWGTIGSRATVLRQILFSNQTTTFSLTSIC